jgi:hypothetical protein
MRFWRSTSTFGMAEMFNIQGGVFIAVMCCATFRTNPFAFGQPQILIDVAANMTAFRGWEKAVDLVEVGSVPLAFIGKLTEQFSPPAIGNPFSKAVVRQHSFHIQVFGVDDLVFVNR